MASVVLFEASPSLKKAASLMNRLETETFAKILSRILQKLHKKTTSLFTPEEHEKLQATLKMESSDLQLVMDTVVFIFQQAAYHLAKPQLLLQQLKDIELAEDKAIAFSQLWSSNGKSFVEKLRSQQFYPNQLDEVKWRLNLQMSQKTMSRLHRPNALLEFTVVGQDDTREKIRLDFNHDELYQFYNKLEVIQDQLDSLS